MVNILRGNMSKTNGMSTYRASRSDSRSAKISSLRTGPFTLRMSWREGSSRNSTRTWVTPPREPVLPRTCSKGIHSQKTWCTSSIVMTGKKIPEKGRGKHGETFRIKEFQRPWWLWQAWQQLILNPRKYKSSNKTALICTAKSSSPLWDRWSEGSGWSWCRNWRRSKRVKRASSFCCARRKFKFDRVCKQEV